MFDNSPELRKRAEEILAKGGMPGGGLDSEASMFATTMLATLYGPQSTQMIQYRDTCVAIAKRTEKQGGAEFALLKHARGVIKNCLAEMDGGLIVKLRAVVAGEVMAEMVRLAKEILNEQNEGAKNVGAVLVAAAYEDLLRRMGDQLAGVIGRPDLQDVVIALKNANALKGGEVGLAQSYLKVRNDSLHADWTNVSRAQAESCLAFIEPLLVKHFS